MNKFLDKLGLFDLFAVLLPGICFLCMCLFSAINFEDCAFLSSIIKNLTNYMTSDNKMVVIFIFFILSYISGMALDQLFRIIESLFPQIFKEYRECWYNFQETENIKREMAQRIFDKVEMDIGKHSDDLTRKDPKYQRFIHQYCMTALEVTGGIEKAEKMSAISEMSGSIFLTCSIGIIFMVLCLLENICANQFKYIVIAYIFILLLLSVLFYKRYDQFKCFRVNATLKSYYIQFIAQLNIMDNAH